MHGGFENETPNIPTNSIIKLDLVAHVKGNPQLMQKIENAFQTQARNGQGAATNKAAGETATGANNFRAATPAMQSLGKSNIKITIGKGEIEQKKGQAP